MGGVSNCGVAAETGQRFGVSPIGYANPAQVPLRSPLRYPGGKSWLLPHVRHWLKASAVRLGARPRVLGEPFVGGGSVALRAVMEGLVDGVWMVESDPDVAALWRAAIRRSDELAERIERFDMTAETVEALAGSQPQDDMGRGFRFLVLNRAARGGVVAPGAGRIRAGDGRGVASRWYPGTLAARVREIGAHSDRIVFTEGDGLAAIGMVVGMDGACLFVDPPYVADSGRQAGRRLYKHSDVAPRDVFAALGDSDVDFLCTYDDCDLIRSLTTEHGFAAVTVAMTSGHHRKRTELVITRRPVFT